jgi:hypothetical protein
MIDLPDLVLDTFELVVFAAFLMGGGLDSPDVLAVGYVGYESRA